jgi:hypothetical protein
LKVLKPVFQLGFSTRLFNPISQPSFLNPVSQPVYGVGWACFGVEDYLDREETPPLQDHHRA